MDISSVDDQSGDATNQSCQAGDATVALAAGTTAFDTWSDTRYLSYLAGRAGMATIGENPGQPADTTPGALTPIMDLVSSCGLTGLQYAFDDGLNGVGGSTGTGVATLSQYAQAIAGRPT